MHVRRLRAGTNITQPYWAVAQELWGLYRDNGNYYLGFRVAIRNLN